MDIKTGMYVAQKIMRDAGLEVKFRGVPRHLVRNHYRPYDGAYNPSHHIVFTGHVWTVNTIVHECCHALQPIHALPEEYFTDTNEYMNCKEEREAFFVGAMAEYDIPIKKGDLERWNNGSPTRSLRLRINDMINRRYR